MKRMLSTLITWCILRLARLGTILCSGIDGELVMQEVYEKEVDQVIRLCITPEDEVSWLRSYRRFSNTATNFSPAFPSMHTRCA